MQGISGSPTRRALLGLLVAATLPSAASASTIDVTFHGDDNNDLANGCALREAIRSANEDASIGGCRRGQGGQVIDVLEVEPGNYELTVTGNDDFADAGDLDITSIMRIDGMGNGFTVDAGGEDGIDDRIFDVRDSGDALIRNVRLRRGHGVMGADGGAVRVAPDGQLKLQHAVLTNNDVIDSGAHGGAVFAQGELKLVDTEVRNNDAVFEGGIVAEGPSLLKRVTVRGNSAFFAGGAVLAGDDMRILDSTISGNSLTPGDTGEHFGGGLTVVTINPDVVLVRNSTISGNESDQDGGGIAVGQGTARVIHSTITNNHADADGLDDNGDGGGIWIDTDGLLEMRSTIVANNFDDGPAIPLHTDCSGEVDSYGFNLVRVDTGCTLNPGSSEDDVATGTNPRLKPLANRGGPTKTHALKPSSELVDLIPRAKCHEGIGLDPRLVRKDQRGVRRPQGSRCDGGAFELD